MFNINPTELFVGIVTIAVPAILAITLHEAAHGYAALVFGDPTASERGRLSLNPLRHVDPMGTIILPAMLYFAHLPIVGWAKPVPVDFARLRHPRRDSVWVAGAGPATNIALAIVSALLQRLVPESGTATAALLTETLRNSIFLNVLLAVFNMLPIPPLDGGRVAVGILPLPLARPLARLEKYGMVILLALLIGLPWLGALFGLNLNIFAWIAGPIVDRIAGVIQALAGRI
jgi:Zn-dependent protease